MVGRLTHVENFIILSGDVANARLFVPLLARANLEIELVRVGGTLGFDSTMVRCVKDGDHTVSVSSVNQNRIRGIMQFAQFISTDAGIYQCLFMETVNGILEVFASPLSLLDTEISESYHRSL